MTEQTEVKPASYTYDTLLVADGRSKNKKIIPAQKTQETEPVETPETSKIGRYVCCECGRLLLEKLIGFLVWQDR